MNYGISKEKIKKRILFIKRKFNPIAYILILLLTIFGVACSTKESSGNIYGTYQIYSEDPEVRRFIEGQDTYIRLNDDQTVIYNSTINNKLKYNIKGKFSYEEKTNTLTINWEEGNLPDKLKIEKEGAANIIRIGNTIYKKDKPG